MTIDETLTALQPHATGLIAVPQTTVVQAVCKSCRGILDYIYGSWWKCRICGRWREL